MWMDIAVIGMIALSMIFSFRAGFIKTFLNTMGWILSILLAFVWYPNLNAFLMEKTKYYDIMKSSIGDKISGAATGTMEETFSGIPSALSKAFEAATDSLSNSVADSITSLFFAILSLVLIILVIKLTFWILIFVFSKEKNDGFTGFIDGVFGFIFGIIKGVLLVLVLMAFLVPLQTFMDTTFFTDALKNSQVAFLFYDHNPVLLFVHGLL